MNKADQVDDEELLELVEMEIRELLNVRVPGRRHADHHGLCAEGAGRRRLGDGQGVDPQADGGDGRLHSGAGA
jgi:hypothetical protein